MTGRVLLLGSTDFTLAVGDAVADTGLTVAGIVYVGDTFKISYAREPVANYRRADVAQWCEEHGAKAIPFETYAGVLGAFEEAPQLALLAGWYHMAPRTFRATFPRGCIGFHASLLPKLRGGAPLNWAILGGLSETGLSLFEIGEGVDDGPLYDQERFPIGPRTRIAELVEASREAAGRIVRRALPGIIDGALKPAPQVGEKTYGLQRSPEDGRIDWRNSAERIDRLIRAVSRPYPGALTTLDGSEIAIHDAAPAALLVHGAPGQVASIPGHDPIVVCGESCLIVRDAEFSSGEDALPALRAAANRRLGS